MNLAIDIVLHAGRSAVDVALYTLLPITDRKLAPCIGCSSID